ncbi:Imm15 family immunity protein [Pseudomonas protegens]|uniref:Imm15 family immunity protein n=1 Tax=Pseudomonas protegens TaxID=380021 RepID=UPI0032096C7D
MDVFFESYESFEEIPLVSRYGRLKHLMDEMSSDGVSDFLTGLALFVLNTLRVLEVSTGKDVFFAVTFTDLKGWSSKVFSYPIFLFTQSQLQSVFWKKYENMIKGLRRRR